MKKRNNTIIVAPSLLSCDFGEMRKTIVRLEKSQAEYLHWDIMDGHFVPNLTMGPDWLKSVRKDSSKIFDVHLMMSHPDKYIDAFVAAGADIITFHIESDASPKKTIGLIKKYKKRVGISIKPKTPVGVIEPYLKQADLVLVMSVEPGFGGQRFRKSALDKIKRLDILRKERDLHYLIEVDGGINDITAIDSIRSGAQVLVIGSWLFKQKNLNKTIKTLKYSMENICKDFEKVTVL